MTLLRLVVRAALAVALLGFFPAILDPFHAAKASAVQVIGLPLALAFGIEAIQTRRMPRRVLDWAVLAWVIASALSTFLGIAPLLSWTGEISQRGGLATTLALAGIYAAARRSHFEVAHARGTLLVVVVCAALSAAYAMLQRAGLDPFSWENLPTYPTGAGAVLRVFGTLGNPILLGSILAVALGAGSALAMNAAAGRTWLIPALMLIATAVAATLSRGAMVAALAGIGVAAALRLRRGDRDAFPAVAGVSAAVLGTAAVWTALGLRAPLLARIAESASPRAESLPARIEIARSAFALWRQHPVLGVGPDAFGLAFPAVQTPGFWKNGWIGIPGDAHSEVLQALATGGAVAIVIGVVWVVALGAAFFAAPRPSAAEDDSRGAVAEALLAGFCALGVGAALNMVGPAGAALFVVFTGLVASLTEPEPAPSPLPVGVFRAAALLAPVLAFLTLREFRALGSAARAHNALEHSITADLARRYTLARIAVSESQRAVALIPGQDELWRLVCDAELAEARAQQFIGANPVGVKDSLTAAAESAARRALALVPRRASNVQRLANALAACGRIAAADSAFDRATALAPYDGLILVERALFEFQSGRPSLAIATARRIGAMYPEEAIGHSVEASLLIPLGRRAEAREALDRALAARWEAGSEARHEAARRARAALDRPRR
jgi:O-antigen ligase